MPCIQDGHSIFSISDHQIIHVPLLSCVCIGRGLGKSPFIKPRAPPPPPSPTSLGKCEPAGGKIVFTWLN